MLYLSSKRLPDFNREKDVLKFKCSVLVLKICQNVDVVDHCDCLVSAQQLQLDTSGRADMHPLRYSYFCLTIISIIFYMWQSLKHLQLPDLHSPLLLWVLRVS